MEVINDCERLRDEYDTLLMRYLSQVSLWKSNYHETKKKLETLKNTVETAFCQAICGKECLFCEKDCVSFVTFKDLLKKDESKDNWKEITKIS